MADTCNSRECLCKDGNCYQQEETVSVSLLSVCDCFFPFVFTYRCCSGLHNTNSHVLFQVTKWRNDPQKPNGLDTCLANQSAFIVVTNGNAGGYCISHFPLCTRTCLRLQSLPVRCPDSEVASASCYEYFVRRLNSGEKQKFINLAPAIVWVAPRQNSSKQF